MRVNLISVGTRRAGAADQTGTGKGVFHSKASEGLFDVGLADLQGKRITSQLVSHRLGLLIRRWMKGVEIFFYFFK